GALNRQPTRTSALASSPQPQTYQPDLRENSAAATLATANLFAQNGERHDHPSESDNHSRSNARALAESVSCRHHRRRYRRADIGAKGEKKMSECRGVLGGRDPPPPGAGASAGEQTPS